MVSARFDEADNGRSSIGIPMTPSRVSPIRSGNVAHSPGASVSGCAVAD